MTGCLDTQSVIEFQQSLNVNFERIEFTFTIYWNLVFLNESWIWPKTIYSSTTLLFDVKSSDYSFPIHFVAKTIFANIPGKLVKYLRTQFLMLTKKFSVFDARCKVITNLLLIQLQFHLINYQIAEPSLKKSHVRFIGPRRE